MSPSCLMKDDYSFASENNGCVISKNGMFVAFASIMNGLFILNLDDASICNISAKRPWPNDLSPTYMWHCRLGHISENRMKKLHSDGLLTSFDFGSYETCEACLLGKMTKAPFTGLPERTLDLLELIHTDVCGPMSTTTRGGFQYFITFTDDFSRYGYVYLMKHKSESLEEFKEFQNEVENQRGKKIKALRSDRGGEYLSHEFSNHLRSCGILPQLTPPRTPQRNGVS
jgi:transposase InsO family protein